MRPLLFATTLVAAAIVALLFCTRNTSAISPVDDTTPPTLVWFTFDPPIITLDTHTITLTAYITDAGIGFEQATINYMHPAGGFNRLGFYFSEVSLITGTIQDGVYRSVEQFGIDDHIPGPYHIHSLYIRDGFENQAVHELPAIERMNITPQNICALCRRLFFPALSSPP